MSCCPNHCSPPSSPQPPPSVSGFRRLLMVLGALALVGVIGLLTWQATRPQAPVTPGDLNAKDREQQAQVRREEQERMTEADARAAKQLAGTKAAASSAAADKADKNTPSDSYGVLPAVPVSANESVKLAVEAARTRTHPERLTPSILPEALDLANWQSNPEYRRLYTATPAPGRCYQSAGPGAPPLSLNSPTYVQIEQGSETVIKVRGKAGFPISATCFDAARFSNLLTTQTVEADKDGIATFTLQATTGVISQTRVLCASPVCEGQCEVMVDVVMPRTAGAQ